ncbi:MAG: hypothetical protein QM784_37010 [Polyangiaceae bacterium]
MDAADDIDELWRHYLELENRGDRAAMLDALAAFVGRIENAPQHTRQIWADECLQASSAPKAGFRVRAPLFQRVLFPELKARYIAGEAQAARALAQLSQELFRFREGWEALGWPSEVDLWKEAYRRDPSAEDARARLVTSTASFIMYTLHELPAGVLYGSNGATLEQCDDLIAELAFFRGLLTSVEIEHFQDLIERASIHYPSYREYLLQDRKQGYAAFLAERSHATDR